MSIIFYDKKTCGTCKKAQSYLNENGVRFEIIDIIKEVPSRELLERFIPEDDVKSILNPRSTIYREKMLGKNPPNKVEAIDLMQQDSNLIKRPFIVGGDQASFGFKTDEFKVKWLKK
jgi:arsenate reductase (glutaredoxin)